MFCWSGCPSPHYFQGSLTLPAIAAGGSFLCTCGALCACAVPLVRGGCGITPAAGAASRFAHRHNYGGGVVLSGGRFGLITSARFACRAVAVLTAGGGGWLFRFIRSAGGGRFIRENWRLCRSSFPRGGGSLSRLVIISLAPFLRGCVILRRIFSRRSVYSAGGVAVAPRVLCTFPSALRRAAVAAAVVSL